MACGGARYVHDALAGLDHLNTTIQLVDQDPAAVAFCRERFAGYENVDPICMPIAKLADQIDGEYDLIVSAGLFDYLDESLAAGLLELLADHLRPGGAVVITNYADSAIGRYLMDWIVDWQLVYRNEADMQAIFPKGVDVYIESSMNKSLFYATAVRSS